MLNKLIRIRTELAEFYDGFKQGMDWYVTEMNSLKYQLQMKDQEIAELKKKLDEKST